MYRYTNIPYRSFLFISFLDVRLFNLPPFKLFYCGPMIFRISYFRLILTLLDFTFVLDHYSIILMIHHLQSLSDYLPASISIQLFVVVFIYLLFSSESIRQSTIFLFNFFIRTLDVLLLPHLDCKLLQNWSKLRYIENLDSQMLWKHNLKKVSVTQNMYRYL